MITYKKSELNISLGDSEPQQRREILIKAIASYMRMYAGCDSGLRYDKDTDNLYTMGQLLEELVQIDK